jgi:hypothetical protein
MRGFFLLFLLSCGQYIKAQTLVTESDTIPRDTTYWTKKNITGLDFSQIAFMNWNAGGNSSVSGLLKGDFSRKYVRGMSFGIMKCHFDMVSINKKAGN